VSDHTTSTLDTGPPPGRRRSAGGWVLLSLGGVFAVVMILGTTWGVINMVGKVTEQRQVTLSPANDRIRVETSSGDVRIQPGDTDQIVVTERIEHTFSTPDVTAVATADGVRLTDGCRWWASTCRVDFTLTVPDGQTIEIHTSAGDITVSGESGPLDLHTSAGDITVSGGSGPLELHTSAGDIRADGITSGRVVARSSAGDVRLRFEQAPDDVRVDTSAGDATVQVPTAGVTYHVEIDTGAGDEHRGVPDDSRAQRHISVHTSAGDATVEPT
jgi:DUF4097 and DUF4098 domain-containing protein YvlB